MTSTFSAAFTRCPTTRRWATLMLGAALAVAGCQSTAPVSPGEAAGQPAASRPTKSSTAESTTGADPAPGAARPQPRRIADEIVLGLSSQVACEMLDGIELDRPEPEYPPSTIWGDGATFFTYELDHIGGHAGRALVVMVVDAEVGERFSIPGGRARVAFERIEGDQIQVVHADAGLITLDTVTDQRLAGRFEVRFDHLDNAIVRGVFDSSKSDTPR